MKKTGFTLAEVLITLAIVGIIAAITLPGLSRNVNQKTVGPTLAKAINNLTTSVNTALADSKAINTTDITEYYNTSNVADIMLLLEANLTGTLQEASGTTPYTFYGNDGITYSCNHATSPDTATNFTEAGLKDDKNPNKIVGKKYSGKYYRMLIDLDGPNNGPNAGGTDQFIVYIDTKGPVIPAGSREAEKYGASYDGTNQDKALKCDSTTVDAVKSRCTSTVIMDGWNVKY